MTIHKIPNQIIKGNLTPLNLSKVTGISIHHMAHPTADVKTVEGWHVNNQGYSAIGYNYFVAFDGTIYEGRGLNLGAHTLGYNNVTIGIGFQGNFHNGTNLALSDMSDVQFNAGLELIKWLKEKIPSIVKVGGHKDYTSTACPGNMFPLYEMVLGKKRGEEIIVITNAEQALDKIIAAGVDTNKSFWLKACEHVKYLEELFIKIANKI